MVDVLGTDLRSAAAFVSEVEAFRYAALICSQHLAPVFRRRTDGAVLKFEEVGTPETLSRWILRGVRADGLARASAD